MSRSKASALLASVMVMLAALTGIALSPSAASAHPRPNPQPQYPPPPPALVVNHAAVWQGSVVYATGRRYRARERVSVVVYWLPPGGRSYRVLRSGYAYANAQGVVYFGVRATNAGYIVIRATGLTSRQSASAAVYVASRRWSNRAMNTVAFSDAGTGAPAAKAMAPEPRGKTAPAVAGVAVLAMAGGALVSRRLVRRKRASV